MAKTSFQVAIDAADTASRDLTTSIVMKHESSLHCSQLPKGVQNTKQDLPFDELSLFIEKMGTSLHL